MSAAKKFKFHRDRTISSTCGISIEFKKAEWHLVPPAMFAEVMAAGGVCEDEVDLGEKPEAPVVVAPTEDAERAAAVKAAVGRIVARADANEFTAAGAPKAAVLDLETGWPVSAKERAAAWADFSNDD